MPGCGKSTVGRQLAKRLDLPLYDTDHEIESVLGVSVRELFEQRGEAAFRDLEQEAVDVLMQRPRGIVATGGGAVLRAANRAALRERSLVLYLKSTPEDLFKRLRKDHRRPLLQVADPLAKLQSLWLERDPLYREVAHFVIETGRSTLHSTVHLVLMQLEMAGMIVGNRLVTADVALPTGRPEVAP